MPAVHCGPSPHDAPDQAAQASASQGAEPDGKSSTHRGHKLVCEPQHVIRPLRRRRGRSRRRGALLAACCLAWRRLFGRRCRGLGRRRRRRGRRASVAALCCQWHCCIRDCFEVWRVVTVDHWVGFKVHPQGLAPGGPARRGERGVVTSAGCKCSTACPCSFSRFHGASACSLTPPRVGTQASSGTTHRTAHPSLPAPRSQAQAEKRPPAVQHPAAMGRK